MKNSTEPQQNILETARLKLRQMKKADLDFVAQMLADPLVMQYYPQPLQREEAAAWLTRQLQRYQKDGFGLWLVEERDTEKPIGQVGVISQNVEGKQLIEVGYLIHQPYWKMGYAIEAASACKQYAFTILKAEAVHSLIRPANIPSQRVALRNGMKPLRMVCFKDLEHLLYGTNQSNDLPDSPACNAGI